MIAEAWLITFTQSAVETRPAVPFGPSLPTGTTPPEAGGKYRRFMTSSLAQMKDLRRVGMPSKNHFSFDFRHQMTNEKYV